MNSHPLAFVDVETSGSNVTRDRIIEIGILRVERDDSVRAYKTLINPRSHVPPYILEMTGINSLELSEAPDFGDVTQEVYEMLEGCIFVAHNARFDYGFVRNEFKRQNLTYSAKVLCTVKLSRMLFPQYSRHNLDCIIDRFQIPCRSRHRAFDDAQVLWEFFRKLRDEYTHLPLQETIQMLLRKPSLPPRLAAGTTEELPESPGVYIFYGDGQVPLYIGKSTSLRGRILSHFSGDNASSTEMMISQQVSRVETIQTAGELGALILEANLIKERKPFYNRRLRAAEALVVIRQSTTRTGYATAVVSEEDAIDPDRLDNLLYVAGSKQKAKAFLRSLCEKHGLCARMLGVDRGSGECFDAKLGKCSGVCRGDEPAKLWNARFDLAFAPFRVPAWPFPGKVLVREVDSDRQRADIFLFDKWCYLATVKEGDYEALYETSYSYEFDPDIYKILRKALRGTARMGLSISPIDTTRQFFRYKETSS